MGGLFFFTRVCQFNKLIERMNKLRADETIGDMKSYVTKLLAWTVNRRGEAYSLQAAAAAEKRIKQLAAAARSNDASGRTVNEAEVTATRADLEAANAALASLR